MTTNKTRKARDTIGEGVSERTPAFSSAGCGIAETLTGTNGG
jgi:hypothetical protein